MTTTSTADIAELKEQIARMKVTIQHQRSKALYSAAFRGQVTSYQLIQALGEGLLVVDRDSEIILTNPRLEEMMGYDPGELIGRSLDVLLPERLILMHRQHVAAYLQKPHIRPMGQGMELLARRKDGSEFPIEVSLSWVDTQLAARFVVALIIDITQRKRAEQALRDQNEALNRFAETVAHDLQSSIAVMMGMSEMLLDERVSLSPTELHQQLLDIHLSSQKMSNIINEILLLSSLHQDEVVLRPLDMISILKAVLQRLEPEMRESQACVQLPASFPLVLGYGPWVEEVWLNYLSNALKYGCSHADIPPQVEVGSTVMEDGCVKFWVKDNGPGIPAERLPHLFTAGQRLEDARARGHGLGLSIVQRIVRKLGGQVGVDSKLGQGSVFSFNLRQAK